MMNVTELQKRLYLQWAGRLFTAKGDNWGLIPKGHLNKIVDHNNIFMVNCKPKQIMIVHDINNEFWKDVIITYLENKKATLLPDMNPNNDHDQQLYYNNLIKYKGNVLFFERWGEKAIAYVKDLVHASEKKIA